MEQMDERLNEMGWMDVKIKWNGTNGWKITWNGTRVCHVVAALPFTLKSILMQKKNYGNSKIFHHTKIQSSFHIAQNQLIFEIIYLISENYKTPPKIQIFTF